MTCIESNTLIAQFMGYEIKGDDFIYPKEMYHLYHPYNLYEIESGEYDFTDDISGMKFHNSWDWLMPVVEKIESLGFWTKMEASISFGTEYKSFNIKKKKPNGDYLYNYEGDWNDSKINAVYIGVIEFIQWYNTIINN